MKIIKKNRVVLYCRSTARMISFVILPKVKKELQFSEKEDIIEQVKLVYLYHFSKKSKTGTYSCV